MNSERPPHDELHRFKSQFKRHIMRTQRLRWVLAEICNTSNYSRHRKVLHSSWKFWCALLLKFVPHVWPFQIQLRLKQGGVIKVTEFMDTLDVALKFATAASARSAKQEPA